MPPTSCRRSARRRSRRRATRDRRERARARATTAANRRASSRGTRGTRRSRCTLAASRARRRHGRRARRWRWPSKDRSRARAKSSTRARVNCTLPASAATCTQRVASGADASTTGSERTASMRPRCTSTHSANLAVPIRRAGRREPGVGTPHSQPHVKTRCSPSENRSPTRSPHISGACRLLGVERPRSPTLPQLSRRKRRRVMPRRRVFSYAPRHYCES
jgi:hypothetical protein